MRDTMEEFKIKLFVLGGQRAVDMYMNNDVSHISISEAIRSGVTLDEIDEAMQIDVEGLDNNNKLGTLTFLKRMSKTGGIEQNGKH